jgi:hypothetical protein
MALAIFSWWAAVRSRADSAGWEMKPTSSSTAGMRAPAST